MLPLLDLSREGSCSVGASLLLLMSAQATTTRARRDRDDQSTVRDQSTPNFLKFHGLAVGGNPDPGISDQQVSELAGRAREGQVGRGPPHPVSQFFAGSRRLMLPHARLL